MPGKLLADPPSIQALPEGYIHLLPIPPWNIVDVFPSFIYRNINSIDARM
jgi:hypothetical protein